MPNSQQPGQLFLTAFTRYVDFRLTDRGQTHDNPDLEVFVDLFAAFVKTRPGAQAHREACARLVEKMGKMKETRGTGDPTPESPTPGG